MISDRLFDGTSYSISVTLSINWDASDINGRYFLLFATMSRDYVEYQRTLATQEYQSDILSVPILVYSNVTGGYQIFAGYTNRYVDISPS